MFWVRTAGFSAVILAFAFVATPAHAQDTKGSGEIFILADAPLDEPHGLCLDIPGHADRVDVTRNLTVHTCKRDIWNLDERFAAAPFENGILHMPEYGMCVAANDTRAGAQVALANCDGSPGQRWKYTDKRLVSAAQDRLCLTVGPEPSELTPGGRRLPSRHVARSLGLADCTAADADRQRWEIETPGG
ncbi:MAG: ricin-type beta-trefoil lectin domain protein [Alphaproteobacteria bacterium]